MTRPNIADPDLVNKLREGRGNLLRQTEKLRALGAKTTAQPPALLAGAGDETDEPLA